jgi:ankyrin repeat protein
LAASEGLLEVVTCLVTELRADSSPVDRWGNTPLDDGIRAGHTSVIKFLRANGAKNGTGASGAMPTRRVSAADLCDAAFSDDVARLRDFVTEGANVNQGDYDRALPPHRTNSPPFGYFACATDLWTLERVLAGRTALHIAASEGNLEVVMYLINEAGADPSPVDRWGVRHEARREHASPWSPTLVNAMPVVVRASL